MESEITIFIFFVVDTYTKWFTNSTQKAVIPRYCLFIWVKVWETLEIVGTCRIVGTPETLEETSLKEDEAKNTSEYTLKGQYTIK